MSTYSQMAEKMRLLDVRVVSTRARVSEARALLKKARRRHAAHCTALEILQEVAKQVQEQVHEQIAGVVTRSLQTVFDEDYEFRIVFEKKRNKTAARLVVVKDDVEVDPMTASGGGVVDVIAFALRMAGIMVRRPRVRPLVLMDEPFKFVSEEYRPGIRQMLQMFAEELHVQFPMVTHMEDLEVGKIVRIA